MLFEKLINAIVSLFLTYSDLTSHRDNLLEYVIRTIIIIIMCGLVYGLVYYFKR